MLRFLQNQVALSTIILHASEREAYTPELARTFSERISMEWASSLKRSKENLENFAVWFVAHVFELAVLAVSLLVIWLVVGRRFWKFLRAPWQSAGV